MTDTSSLFQKLAEEKMASMQPPVPTEPTVPTTPLEPVVPQATSEPVVAPQAVAPDATPSSEPIDFAKIIKEKYGYDNPEKFFSDFESKPKEIEKEIDLPNERLKKLVEYVKNGGKEEDFYKTQFTDWDSVPQDNLLKMMLKDKYPTANEKQIDALIKKNYSTDEDELSEDEVELNKLKIDTETLEYRAKKKEEQIKVLDKDLNQKNAEQIKNEKEYEEFTKQWNNDADKALNDLSSLNYDLEFVDENGEKGVFNTSHSVDKNTIKEIEEYVKNPKLLLKLYTNENGLVDVKKLAEGVYMQRNFKRIVSEIANKHATDVKEAFIKKNLINANFKGVQQSPTGAKSEYQMLKDAYESAKK